MPNDAKVIEFPIIQNPPNNTSSLFTEKIVNSRYTIDNGWNDSEGRDDMDNRSLEKYIEKMELDNREFRNEMRERDMRAEERLQQMESRIAESQRQSEERFNQSVAEMKTILYQTQEKVQDIEKQNRHFNIANLVAIIGLVIAFLVGLTQINQGFTSIIQSITSESTTTQEQQR